MLSDILLYQARTGLTVEPHDDALAHQVGYRAEDRIWAIRTEDLQKCLSHVAKDIALFFRSTDGRRQLVAPTLTVGQAFSAVWERLYAPEDAYQEVTPGQLRAALVSVLSESLPRALSPTERWVLARVTLQPMSKLQLSDEWQLEARTDTLAEPVEDSDFDPQAAMLEDLIGSLRTARVQEPPSRIVHAEAAIYDAADRLLAIGLVQTRGGKLHRLRQ